MRMDSVEIQTAMTPPKFRSPHPKKVHIMHVRLNSGELELLTKASEAIGSPVSTWARVTLLAEARKILRRAREQ